MSSIPFNVVLNKKRTLSNNRFKKAEVGKPIPYKIWKVHSDRDEPDEDVAGPANVLDDRVVDNAQPDMSNSGTQTGGVEEPVPYKIDKIETWRTCVKRDPAKVANLRLLTSFSPLFAGRIH